MSAHFACLSSLFSRCRQFALNKLIIEWCSCFWNFLWTLHKLIMLRPLKHSIVARLWVWGSRLVLMCCHEALRPRHVTSRRHCEHLSLHSWGMLIHADTWWPAAWPCWDRRSHWRDGAWWPGRTQYGICSLCEALKAHSVSRSDRTKLTTATTVTVRHPFLTTNNVKGYIL